MNRKNRKSGFNWCEKSTKLIMLILLVASTGLSAQGLPTLPDDDKKIKIKKSSQDDGGGLIKDEVIKDESLGPSLQSLSKASGRDESVAFQRKPTVSKLFRHRLFGLSTTYNLFLYGKEPANMGYINSTGHLFGMGALMDLDMKNFTVTSAGVKSRRWWMQLGVQIAFDYVGGQINQGNRMQDLDYFSFQALFKYYFPLKEMGFRSPKFLGDLTPFAGMGPAFAINTRDVIEEKDSGFIYGGPGESDFQWMIGGGTLYQLSKGVVLSLTTVFAVTLTRSNTDFFNDALTESNTGQFFTRLGVLYPF